MTEDLRNSIIGLGPTLQCEGPGNLSSQSYASSIRRHDDDDDDDDDGDEIMDKTESLFI